MGRSGCVLLLSLWLLVGCSAARPKWLEEEDAACFRLRDFTEEIPRMYWGDPARDPCWRYRSPMSDR
ncbi:MAG TPA: hypothetical protein VHF87_13820 [Methylomirabilota bacterium]|jgi:hypothetical protein|nr:hypothetical protein [Methylomirabilota bacterium]